MIFVSSILLTYFFNVLFSPSMQLPVIKHRPSNPNTPGVTRSNIFYPIRIAVVRRCADPKY